MLWYKNWLETRFRLIMPAATFALIVVELYSRGVPPAVQVTTMLLMLRFFSALAAVFLAGAGVRTQGGRWMSKVAPGSMFYTLSLPVSRWRLLAVRASLGMIETTVVTVAMCCLVWAMFPIFKTQATLGDAALSGLIISIGVAGFYSISVVASAFLGDIWQTWASGLVIAALAWIWSAGRLPVSWDVYRTPVSASPLFSSAHVMPWHAMGISLVVAAVLLAVAWRVIESREY